MCGVFFSCREEDLIEKALSRKLSKERSAILDDRTTRRFDDKATEPKHNMVILSPTMIRERSRTESILDEERSMNETSSKMGNTPSSRVSSRFQNIWVNLDTKKPDAFLSSQRPLILRVPQSESFSSLSNIMKRIQPQPSSSGLLKRGSKAAVSELSHSMMDLSVHKTDTNDVPVPRFKASVSVYIHHISLCICLWREGVMERRCLRIDYRSLRVRHSNHSLK